MRTCSSGSICTSQNQCFILGEHWPYNMGYMQCDKVAVPLLQRQVSGHLAGGLELAVYSF